MNVKRAGKTIYIFVFHIFICLVGKVATFPFRRPTSRDFRLSISTTSTESHTNLEYKSYIWKHDYEIGYVSLGDENNPPLLLIPGFGVGAFHYERNIPKLAEDYCVFSLDLLGQGSSWPSTQPMQEQQLSYGVDMWLEQIVYFIEHVIKRPVHVVGNSLGELSSHLCSRSLIK